MRREALNAAGLREQAFLESPYAAQEVWGSGSSPWACFDRLGGTSTEAPDCL
jgi:hypothetical protein